MDAAELDIQLEELETRLERLRALYEQYFLGIEKIEPSVARKDVDRRIYLLRREKIHNTAKRFKLQTIIQRYNTFQQYWQRICREIENGTYKRHVLRAERTYGPQDLLTVAARKRLGKAALEAPEAPPPSSGRAARSTPPRASSTAPPRPSSLPPRPSARPGSIPPSSAPRAGTPPPPGAQPVAASGRVLAPPPKPARGATAGPPDAAPTQPAKRPPSARPAFESLELDMDFLGDWDPAAAFKPPTPKTGKTPAAPAAAQKKAAEPASPPAREAEPAQATKPASPPPAEPTKAPAKAAKPAGRRPATPSAPDADAKARRAQAAAREAAATALNEERIRALHSKLNELKRQNREAGQVSLDGLARSLRATEQKLREKHAGRRIDFDVVIKDGKAVVKPIVR